MKILIGTDFNTSYVFTPGTAGVGTIALYGLPFGILLEQVLMVVDASTGVVVYNPLSTASNGSIAGNVLTLETDTSMLSASDRLQVWVTISPDQVNILTDSTSISLIQATVTAGRPYLAVEVGLPSFERQCAPYEYTAEEVTDVIDPNDQIPISITPAILGQQSARMSQSVALATEHIQDLQGPLVSFQNPPASTNLVMQDCIQYRQVAIQIIGGSGISAGVITFEGSNGGDSTSTWVPIPLFDAAMLTAPITSYTVTASQVKSLCGPLNFRYFRARVSTSLSGGVVSVLPIYRMVPYSPAMNASNIAQISSTNVVNAGLGGTLAVGGNIAPGSSPTLQPLTIGAVDVTGLVRRVVSDVLGNLSVVGPASNTYSSTNPVQVQDAATSLATWRPAELLELILAELKCISYYLKEMPLALNSLAPQAFKEEVNDFIGNKDVTNLV